MVNQRNRLYLITGVVCFFGLIWIALDHFSNAAITVCPVKLLTGYPCPSCGTTRSISALFNGHVVDAFMINPFGILSTLILISVILLLCLDLITQKDYYYRMFNKVEKFLQKNKLFSAVLILLVISNWIWNITKGL